MSLIAWRTDFSVNIKEIDEQHKKLLDLINELHDCMKTDNGKDTISKVLDDLVQYTIYHFSTEEKLFERYKYPGTKLHKQQHQDLINQVDEIKKRYETGETVLETELITFLGDWLNDHIIGSDKQFAPYLNIRGVV